MAMSDIHRVMLATASKRVAPDPEEALRVLEGRDWMFDTKWDGVRCMADITEGKITLINRNMRDITFKYPDVVEYLDERVPDNGRWVLDGELIHVPRPSPGNLPRPDFERLAKRDRLESTPSAAKMAMFPVVFVAFDVLMVDGHDARPLPFASRANVLTRLARDRGMVHHPPTFNGSALFGTTKERGIEGIMAKDPEAPYRPGRQDSWVKLKHVHRVTCVVRSYEMGSNSFSDTLGAMHLEMVGDGDLVHVGRVGTGFSIEERNLYRDRLDAGETLIVEIEYANVTGGGTLRFPSFKGERMDVGLDGCMVNQLETT